MRRLTAVAAALLIAAAPARANGIDDPSIEFVGYDEASGKYVVSVTTTFTVVAPYTNNVYAWVDFQNVTAATALQDEDMTLTARGNGAYACTAYVLVDPGCLWKFRCCGVGCNTGPQDSSTEVSEWVYFYAG